MQGALGISRQAFGACKFRHDQPAAAQRANHSTENCVGNSGHGRQNCCRPNSAVSNCEFRGEHNAAYLREELPAGRALPPEPAPAAAAEALAGATESAALTFGPTCVVAFGDPSSRWAITNSFDPPKKLSITCARACARASSAVRFGL